MKNQYPLNLRRLTANDIVISADGKLGRLIVAQLVVRDIEDEVKIRLKRRAARHGRSMEDEIRNILRDATKESSRPITKLGTRIAERFKGKGLTDELPELRGQTARPSDFEP